MSAETLSEEIPDRSLELVGTEIGGRYVVTGVIGQGGMGVVYRALHLELQQPVAIKVLPAVHARDHETLKRFEQEARTASRVKHPNVVQVFDLGRLPTGEPYLAMELLDGHDLESVVAEGRRLTTSELLDMLRPIAAALDALHQQHVVHRDVKPSNVFFTKGTAGQETVKLVDFGLATLTAAGEGAERLTRVGHVVGTAIYMPPESARGALCEPSGDIYSLAVMTFELLAGRAPFDGQPMAVLMDKVTQKAPTLSQISGVQFGREIEAVFAQALEREPSRRPRTAADFVERLARALATQAESVPAPVVSTGPRAAVSDVTSEPPPPRRRTGAIALGIGAALLLVLVGYLGLVGGASSADSSVAVPLPPPITPVSPVVASVDIDVPLEATPVAVEPVARSAAERAVVEPAIVEPVVEADNVATPVLSSRSPIAHTPRPTRVAPTAAPEVEAPPSEEVVPTSTSRTADLVREASRAMLHGQIPHARDLYREATQSSPRDAAAWRGLGLASERLGLGPEARTAYQRYLDLAPGAGDAATVRERMSRL